MDSLLSSHANLIVTDLYKSTIQIYYEGDKTNKQKICQ